MLESTLASLGLSMRPSRSMHRHHRCTSNVLLLLSSVRAGMATDTTTGIVIGNVESGTRTITITGSGTMFGTITTGIAVSMTTTVVAREAIGTTGTKATAVGVTIDTNGTGCRIIR